MADVFSLTAHNHQFISEHLARYRESGGPRNLLLVDATAGNGHDTLFLARQAGSDGQVLAFDVQEAAISATARWLEANGLHDRVRLIHASHADLSLYLAPNAGVDAAMFNLGYLPGSDKQVTTRTTSTLTALTCLAERIRPRGLISVHTYAGHPGGDEESQRVEAWFAGLPWREWRVLRLDFANKPRNPERVLLALRNAASGHVAEYTGTGYDNAFTSRFIL